MADEIISEYGDEFNPKFSASEDPQSSFQPIDSASTISADAKKFPLIVSNQNQECAVMINSASSASAEEYPEISETSVEKIVVCDSACASSENGGNMISFVDKIQILDVELEKESLKVDAVHHFETIGTVEDGNQEVEERDFARSVLGFDGNQDCTKKELVREVQLASAANEADGKEPFARTEELLKKEADSESILEMKKKLLLEEFEAMLIPGDEIHLENGNNPPSSGGIVDNCGKMMRIDEEKIADQQNDSENMNILRRSHLSLRNSLKIEVIDETALVEPVHVSKIGNGEEIGIVCPTRSMQIKANKSHEPERGGKKAKRSRRRAREAKVSEMHWNLGNVNELGKVDGRQKNGEGNKIVYSMKDMEALRFVNVAEQKRMWKAICKELLPLVAREYSSLTSSNYPMKIGSTSDPRQHLKKREEGSSIIREGCSESLDGEIEDMEGDNEIKKIVSSEPSCSLSVSEDSDDDKYYHSIQRPAFLVEGKPNFDSGPPEDGLEYLRRVRWEATRIPNVTVAKVDRSNFKKEQSVYMPVIPAIVKCPDHLLPSKEWENAFLADFSELRQALSHSEEFMQSDFILHEKIDSIDPNLIDDQPSVLPANDIESHQPEKPNASTSAKENSCNDYPSLTAISKMNSVFRVSSLRKRINSLETQTTLSRTDCLWLFALSAAVDTPLDGDTCAAFRSLLRKCASLRAEKTELDDEDENKKGGETKNGSSSSSRPSATMVRTRSKSASATPHSIPFKIDRQPTATTPKTPLTSSASIIPSSLKSVFLYDWWLVKPDVGEGLAVGGFSSRERAGLRVFYSAAISKRHEATILEAKDGIIITVSGFINRSRTHENGFPSNVYNHFLLGFPFNWKDYMGSSSDQKSPFECIKSSTSHSDHQGTSHNLEPDLDNLAVTRLRDLILSTYGESSHDLFMKISNSSCSPTKNFESGLETPKDPQRANSYQYLKEQGFRDEGKNDAVKDPLHARQEAKSKVEIEPQIPGSRGVCTRSMTKLKNSSNISKESLISNSQKRKKGQENNSSCEKSGKGTEQRVKSSSNVTSTTDFSIRTDEKVDAISDKSESRRSNLRLRNRKRDQ